MILDFSILRALDLNSRLDHSKLLRARGSVLIAATEFLHILLLVF